MMKYIDADKLIAEIERRKEKWLAESRLIKKGKDKAMYAAGKSSAYTEFFSYLTSLQQEQPETNLLEEAYMRGFAQGAKEERERMLADITKMRDTAEKRGLNFGAECGFQIALDELAQMLTGKH